MFQPWDYLIVTASNEIQASAYRRQLDLRRQLGLLTDIGHVLVVGDLQGKRIGSGGSTLLCLMHVLSCELREANAEADVHSWNDLQTILGGRRILIIHAGGDSRRLPAYSPAGKLFVPVPGENDCVLGQTLFDRQLSTYMKLPAPPVGRGQILVTSGDALILGDFEQVCLDASGMIALGCLASVNDSSKHGVFCADDKGVVRLYLQKPSPEEQARQGAVNSFGQSVLDIGVMSFDASAAIRMMQAFDVVPVNGPDDLLLGFAPAMRDLILEHGLDLYREIGCALGSEAKPLHHRASAHGSGSKWSHEQLERLFPTLNSIECHLQLLSQCRFLHFGTTRQLISSGIELLQHDEGVVQPGRNLCLNQITTGQGRVIGNNSWLEACRVESPVTLGGDNVLVGVNVTESLVVPRGACIDVIAGRNRAGASVHFVRVYHINDTFKDSICKNGTLCGIPMVDWLAKAGLKPADVWEGDVPDGERTLWNARIFPAECCADDYQKWLWLFQPDNASAEQKEALKNVERYSVAEMALLADQESFYIRRSRHRAQELRHVLRRLYRRDSGFSATELACALGYAEDPGAWFVELIAEAHQYDSTADGGMKAFVSARILHSLASAIRSMAGSDEVLLVDLFPSLLDGASAGTLAWLKERGLDIEATTKARQWSDRAANVAFDGLSRTILASSLRKVDHPKNSLRHGETVWGRAPARLELGGGWTDTPPYTLEYGGSVINTAVNLNGQPPIHCYGRVISEPVIRLFSIEAGLHVEIRELGELLDYRNPRDLFGLVKAALAISGFSTDMAEWPQGITLRSMLEQFGGGIELTTLAGIPTGSGLGTSSIVGAVVVGVVNRMLGRSLTHRELFHNVLRLEQALTTGGGWQDQIGGGVGGTKLTSTLPGLFPDPRIHYVPDDVIDPRLNGGTTLLYYTGITRLAKNILRQIVGDYLDRQRSTMSCLRQELEVARCIQEAMSRKDPEAFGHYVDVAWRLQKQLCSEVTNKHIERLLNMVRPHIFGARILGAGSGGFMLMICKSPQDAAHIRERLLKEPLNDRARFFDFEVNYKGLEITTC